MNKGLHILNEYASAFNDPKWLCSIKITGFSRNREKNAFIIKKIEKIVFGKSPIKKWGQH